MIELTIVVKIDNEIKVFPDKYLISEKALRVGNENKDFLDKYPISGKALQLVLDSINDIYRTMPEGERVVWQKGFYNSFNYGLSEKDRSNIGKLLSECGIRRGGNKNKPWINFDGFDYDKLKAMILPKTSNQGGTAK
jgi:hypothetical protein